MIFFVELGPQNNTNPVTGLPEASKNARRFSFEYFFILIQKITAEKVVGYWFKPFGFATSFNSKKINQVIGKKDMLILRIVDFQYSFRSNHFNLHSSHSSMYIKELGQGFWVNNYLQEFSFLLECLAHWLRRLHQDDLNYIKCWKKNSLLVWYVDIFRCVAALLSELCNHLNLQ